MAAVSVAVLAAAVLGDGFSGAHASRASGDGSIRSGWGIAAIELGLSVREVRDRLGAPNRISHADPRFRLDVPVVRYA
jgi:hypothetical protein